MACSIVFRIPDTGRDGDRMRKTVVRIAAHRFSRRVPVQSSWCGHGIACIASNAIRSCLCLSVWIGSYQLYAALVALSCLQCDGALLVTCLEYHVSVVYHQFCAVQWGWLHHVLGQRALFSPAPTATTCTTLGAHPSHLLLAHALAALYEQNGAGILLAAVVLLYLQDISLVGSKRRF